MLNQQEYSYLQDYLFTNFIKNGYTNYYCETIYNSYNNNLADVQCYLSKNDLVLENNLLIGTEVKKCNLDFDVSNSDNVNFLTCETIENLSFNVNVNEVNYSNLTTDILFSKTFPIQVISIILLIIFLYFLLKSIFGGK